MVCVECFFGVDLRKAHWNSILLTSSHQPGVGIDAIYTEDLSRMQVTASWHVVNVSLE